MKTTQLSLQTRKSLATAAMSLKQPVPAVFVAGPLTRPVERGAKQETREQAELRRERVDAITRKAPEVVITRRWIHTASHFDGIEAVVMKLPLIERIRAWMRSE